MTKWNIYLEQSKTRSMSHTAIGYARYCNELIPPMYFLNVIHFHHFRPWLFFIQQSRGIVIVSDVKSSRQYPDLIMNVTRFWILLNYIWTGGLSVIVSCQWLLLLDNVCNATFICIPGECKFFRLMCTKKIKSSLI